ncbi:O-antigen ligase family protein, partial [Clostridium butyricum]
NDLVIRYIIFIVITLLSNVCFYYEGINTIIDPYIRLILLLPILIYIYLDKNIDFIQSLIKYSFIINIIGILEIIKDINNFGRIKACFSHPNFYAFYLVILFISIIYSIEKKSIRRRTGILYICINILLILAAGSKTALISLAIVCLYRYRKYLLNKNLLVKILIILISITVIFLIYYNFKDDLVGLRTFNINYGLENNQINSFDWRLMNWKLKFIDWKESWFGIFFGYGWGSEVLYGIKGSPMHNEYLRILFNTGIVGMIAIINISFLIHKKINSILLESEKRFFISIILIIIVGSLSENLFVAVETTNLFLALIFSIRRYTSN